jgi:hypothetical protein
MNPESKETTQPSSESATVIAQPRKQWQTPRFEQHDVRTTTQAKAFNAVETAFAGPVS